MKRGRKIKRPRPHIPLHVRVMVAERQPYAGGFPRAKDGWPIGTPLKFRLDFALDMLFGEKPAHLDHDPPLRARAFNPRTGKYTPDANDPDYLIYRTAEDHRVKTNVRGDHGQYSDRALIRREKKRERRRSGKKFKHRWPKGRKIQNRPFPKGKRPFQKRG